MRCEGERGGRTRYALFFFFLKSTNFVAFLASVAPANRCLPDLGFANSSTRVLEFATSCLPSLTQPPNTLRFADSSTSVLEFANRCLSDTPIPLELATSSLPGLVQLPTTLRFADSSMQVLEFANRCLPDHRPASVLRNRAFACSNLQN